jgi:peptide deformylase
MQPKLLEQVQAFAQLLSKFPELCYIGEPVLRQTSQAVSVTEGVKISEKLVKTLMAFRKATGLGRGLAAPQIGLSKSVFVTFVGDQIQTFLNPRVIDKSTQTNFYRELCLSCGMIAADVERPEWVILEWQDEKGKKYHQKAEGFLARLWQHEEAHLRGLVNIDESYPRGIEFITFDPLAEKLRKTIDE